MRWGKSVRRAFICMAAAALLIQGTGVMGGLFNTPAGVLVDATGVLRTRTFSDPGGRLTRQRRQEAIAALNADVAKDSKLRKVSLNRLEAHLKALLDAGQAETREMKYLAGLTRITHVFYYPESKDIVVAGPAEGFMEDLSGRAVGVKTGQAILELQDLIVALRAFSPTGEATNVVSVSIDPTKQGLANFQQYLAQVGGAARPGMERRLTAGMKEALGLQTVTIKGISPETHFAQVLVEADYRMKLIGIELERPRTKITSYVSRANPRSVARNAMQRWYFTPNYDTVVVSDDHLAMELRGDGVKLVSENELVQAGGVRVDSKLKDAAAEAFAQSFTNNYGALAKESPVYAQMRNCIDLLIASAYIQQQDFYAQSGWDLGVFANEAEYPVQTLVAPVQVETAVNAIWKGHTLMTPIGGGVNIQPRKAVSEQFVKVDQAGEVAEARQAIQLPKNDRWWWD
ncbi:MAG: DUF1598 domain-containing protein [Planctomycetales bacterium]|nr:DUF1598 domain-containing protein [Planctomycetales bacterium]